MSEPDELYTLRNLFWLGNYQQAINEANGLHRLPTYLVGEKEEYVYRSYLAQGQYRIIISEIKENPSTSTALLAIKLFATYLSDPSSRSVAKLQVQEWLKSIPNPTLQLIAAMIHMHEDEIKEAIRSISSQRTLEQSALLVQLYLRINQPDHARQVLKQMKTRDEDSVLVSLANAWINLSPGGKAQEAAYAYDDLIDKFGASALLLNGLAMSKMQQGLFEEAETHLNDALNRAPMDPDTLANLICVAQHLDRPTEVINRYISQLQSKSPNHALLQALNSFTAAFDTIGASLA